MALSPPFFPKRATVTGLRRPGTTPLHTTGGEVPGADGAPRTAAASLPARAAEPAGGSTLTVGPHIKLKGVEITDCDTLVVEGLVEVNMDARLIRIAAPGAFKGAATVDLAEIHGQFEGQLTVRQKLTIHASGKVSGQIRYGALVIVEGGQLCGDIQCDSSAAPSSDSLTHPALLAAA